MLANPKIGHRVRLVYAAAKRAYFDLHNESGVIVVAGRGKPRYHLVELDNGRRVVVPCGNLVKVDEGVAPTPETRR
jgi:hypothetical protein